MVCHSSEVLLQGQVTRYQRLSRLFYTCAHGMHCQFLKACSFTRAKISAFLFGIGATASKGKEKWAYVPLTLPLMNSRTSLSCFAETLMWNVLRMIFMAAIVGLNSSVSSAMRTIMLVKFVVHWWWLRRVLAGTLHSVPLDFHASCLLHSRQALLKEYIRSSSNSLAFRFEASIWKTLFATKTFSWISKAACQNCQVSAAD